MRRLRETSYKIHLYMQKVQTNNYFIWNETVYPSTDLYLLSSGQTATFYPFSVISLIFFQAMQKLLFSLQMFQTATKISVNSSSYVIVLWNILYYTILLAFFVTKGILHNLVLFLKTLQLNEGKTIYISVVGLNFWRRNYFFNFSTLCI